MSIATADMKHGLKVTIDATGDVWDVLDKTPRPGAWWLHRWEGGQWHTCERKQTDMDATQELSPVLTKTDKWKKGPFNVSSRASDTGRNRVQGHVVGVWGVHRNDSKIWVLTHLPTGMGVPTGAMLGYSPNAADMRRAAEYLASLDFPELDAAEFGKTPSRDAIATLRDAVSQPLSALVNA